MEALLDNDILLKTACYGLLNELLFQDSSPAELLGVLGAARFVVTKKIRKRTLRKDKEAVIKTLETFLVRVSTVEPTADEQIMAADFELAAQRLGVALDAGESQLCAVFVARALHDFYTGDKRAIHAMEVLLEADLRLRSLIGKVRCLEQLVRRSVSKDNVSSFRAAVCSEPEIDTALTICFSCACANATLEGVIYGLDSYINDLRRHAQQVLAS
jgi:hypothetical protein